MFRRAAVVAGTAGVALLMSTGSAFAHDCYIANRSDQGDAGASSSQAWYTVDIQAELLQPLVDTGFWTQQQDDCVVATATALGADLTFTTHVKGANGLDGVIGSANPNEGWGSDGKGIDEVDETILPLLVQAADTCGAPLPPME